MIINVQKTNSLSALTTPQRAGKPDATPRINLGREKPSSDEVWDLAASGGTIMGMQNDTSHLGYLPNKEYPLQYLPFYKCHVINQLKVKFSHL